MISKSSVVLQKAKKGKCRSAKELGESEGRERLDKPEIAHRFAYMIVES